MQDTYSDYARIHNPVETHCHASHADCKSPLGDLGASKTEGITLSDSLSDTIEKILKSIFYGFDVANDIEPNLLNINLMPLNKAIDDAIDFDFGTENEEFLRQLKESQNVFAAFKTHREQNDIARQLLDEKGQLKDFGQFKKDVEAIIGEYNQNWLKTEYDTSVIRARMGAKFKLYQSQSDVLPNLKWLQTTSKEPRPYHEKYWGLVLPIYHPFWQEHFPGDLWNCKCGITNTDEPVSESIPDDENYTLPAGLDGNPAFTNDIFSQSHPYYAEAYDTAAGAIANYLTSNM